MTIAYGEGGIRTHGTSRYTRFQVERDRPLRHLSKIFLQYHSKVEANNYLHYGINIDLEAKLN